MTLYRIIVNIAYVFRAFNFCTRHVVRKYFNNEIFAIYGTCTCTVLNLVLRMEKKNSILKNALFFLVKVVNRSIYKRYDNLFRYIGSCIIFD